MEESSDPDSRKAPSQSVTAVIEVFKLIMIVLAWITFFWIVIMSQVKDLGPEARVVAGLFIMFGIIFINDHWKRENRGGYLSIIYYTVSAMGAITTIIGFIIFAASLEQIVGVPFGAP